MANGWSFFVGLAIVLVLGIVGYIFAPKGENITVWRSSILLTLASCYFMWALTLLSQLHPLIAPNRSDFREGYVE